MRPLKSLLNSNFLNLKSITQTARFISRKLKIHFCLAKLCLRYHWKPSRGPALVIYCSMGTGSDLTDPTGSRHVNRPFCMGKPENGPPKRCTIRASFSRRGRGGPPRPRRTTQIATDPPHTSYRPLRPGERVDGGDEGSHGTCVAWADLSGEPAAEGAPQGAAGPHRPGEAGSVHPAEDERGHHTV